MAKTYHTKSVQIVLLCIFAFLLPCNAQFPIVINTWRFTTAAEKAWQVIQDSSALDTIEQGCSVCEIEQCDGSVGYGGSPDESGETTLDAMIMNGADLNVGAVVGIRRIKSAISVARRVLENTLHSMLAGDLATKFAIEMGFKEETLSTNSSTNAWKAWKDRDCQPNYRIHVKPNPTKSCGPYKPSKSTKTSENMTAKVGADNHDTIGMVAIDKAGNIAAGTTTNGLQHKVPGRIGDSPIPGAGAYADNTVGGAAATGDGDVMMRFLPSFLAVEEMRRGTSPGDAAKIAIMRITKYHPNFFGGVIAINKEGVYGAACNGMKEFPFSVANPTTNRVNVEAVPCQENFVMQF